MSTLYISRLRDRTKALGYLLISRVRHITLASASMMWTLGIVCFFYAASLGPITIVSATVLISPLFTLFFATLITKYLPRVLKEEIDTGTVTLKLIAIVLIVIGTYIIVL